MAANTVWGLDIGNSAIKLVKMVRLGSTCSIVEFDIVDIPGGGEEDRERLSRVQSAMAGLAQEHKFGSDPVYISVPSKVCRATDFSVPKGTDKIAELVQFEARQKVPLPLDQVEWGYTKYDDPNGVGISLIYVRKTDIQELLKLTEDFDLNLQGVVAAPVALFNFIAWEFAPASTTLILDAGAKGTDFVVMNKPQFYFRTISIAGRDITRVLENKFKVPYEKAEELKKNISQSPQMDKILSVIEPTLRNLGSEIQRTIGFYKSKARNQRISQCYLLGHTFRLPKMAEFLQLQIREAPFALVEGLQRIKLDDSVNAEVWENEFPTMAVAIGLGIQGLGLSEVNLNLIPSETRLGIAVNRWKKWTAAAIVVVLVTLGLIYYRTDKADARFSEVVAGAAKTEEIVKKLSDDEKAAVAGLPDKELLLKRLERVGHERGKLVQIYDRLAGLKYGDGRAAVFGPESKMYLTNLYVSRMPFTGTRVGTNLDAGQRAPLEKSANLAGPNSFYAPLKNFNDPYSMPAELRPDVPLIVIVTGEVAIEAGQKDVALSKISKMVDALRRQPEIVPEGETQAAIENDVRTEPNEVQLPLEGPPLEYADWAGKKPKGVPPPGGNAQPPEAPMGTYLVFNTIFRWNDAADRDIEVSDLPKKEEAAPTAKK